MICIICEREIETLSSIWKYDEKQGYYKYNYDIPQPEYHRCGYPSGKAYCKYECGHTGNHELLPKYKQRTLDNIEVKNEQ